MDAAINDQCVFHSEVFGQITYDPEDLTAIDRLNFYASALQKNDAILGQIIKPGMHIIDVAANIGEVSLTFSRMVGTTGSVHAFEQNRNSYQRLRRNIQAQPLNNVVASEDCIGHNTDERTPHRLDDYALDCDVLRIGTRVNALEVILGAQTTINQHKPYLCIERDGEEDIAELVGFIHGLGYQIYCQDVAAIRNMPETADTRVTSRFRILFCFPVVPASRPCPSPGYLELLNHYQTMHSEGYHREVNGEQLFTPAEQAFPGNELLRFAETIQSLTRAFGSRSLLDYGSGKGQPYHHPVTINGQQYSSLAEYWGVAHIHCYEPAIAELSQWPGEIFDAVFSTDVLEHLPEADLPWIIEEMFAHARHFVFCSAACHPALARLPDGSNAHCTIQPPRWWSGLFKAIALHHPDVRYVVALFESETQAGNSPRSRLSWASNIELEIGADAQMLS